MLRPFLNGIGRASALAIGAGFGYGLLCGGDTVSCGSARDINDLRSRVASLSRQLDDLSLGNSPAAATQGTGLAFKSDLHRGVPKFGLFVNSGSVQVTAQLAHMGYDWLLIDAQHGASSHTTLVPMLGAIRDGGAKSLVRVGGFDDVAGIQQALDAGADGVLVPYINTAEEARQAVASCRYPLGSASPNRAPAGQAGTRSVYFPQPCMNKDGLLGYAGAANDNVIIALQVETADCIKNIEEIGAIEGIDILFLGQNDLCMSMGLYDKYEFPHMYTSPELAAATDKLLRVCSRRGIAPGIFLFGTDKVPSFRAKGFHFVSVGNDLHHLLVAGTGMLGELKASSKGEWSPRPNPMVQL